ncbi:MAG: putative membrane protein [Psychromonas sp.]|jgi:putative membrane protein|uniref:YidH family protein n=1 Tax=Psychromonas sp. TaxID=1884585 RepID=UPI0039E3AF60
MAWKKLGKSPDYRFTLANERTFLAWIRTSLAFLAAAIGIDQLAPNLAPEMYREVIALLLSLFSASLAYFAYRRWSKNEQAMRGDAELSYTRILGVISLIMITISFLIIYLLLFL